MMLAAAETISAPTSDIYIASVQRRTLRLLFATQIISGVGFARRRAYPADRRRGDQPAHRRHVRILAGDGIADRPIAGGK